MPPRNRRLVAREQPEEEQQEQEGSKNPSLRSFFPLEIVKLILAELHGDLPSLASFCLVSFGWLEEASEELYRDAVVRSERGLVSFFCGANLKKRSRLFPHLSLSQTQTLLILCGQLTYPSVLIHHLVQKGKSELFFPPRLDPSSPLPLSFLRIAPLRLSSASNSPLTLVRSLCVNVFPHLNPLHLELASGNFPEAALMFSSDMYDWERSRRSWTRLSSLSAQGNWGIMEGDRFFLAGLKQLKQGEEGGGGEEGDEEDEVALTFTLRMEDWSSVRCLLAVRQLQDMEILGWKRMRTKMAVESSSLEEIRDGVKDLLEDQERERFELVVLEEGEE